MLVVRSTPNKEEDNQILAGHGRGGLCSFPPLALAGFPRRYNELSNRFSLG